MIVCTTVLISKVSNIYLDPNDTIASNLERKLVTNKLLDDDNDQKNLYYVKYIPSILINGKVFWGNWTPDNLLEIICNSLLTKPDVCKSLNGFTAYKSHKPKPKPSLFKNKLVIGLIISCFVISLVIFIYCRYKIQQNITQNLDSSNFGHKISTVVTSYIALKENKAPSTSRSLNSTSML